MRCIINEKEYIYHTCIKNKEKIRKSFDGLAKRTFGLSFETWHQSSYWGDDYIPHVLIDEDGVAANVSINIMNTIWENKKKRYIQLGTVMTDLKYRNQGLARFLIENILVEWKDQCDGMYLFANDRVLDFYPKFGFVKAEEYQNSMLIQKTSETVRKLDMADKKDRNLLLDKYETYSNPYSALPIINNTGLLMFYCLQFMKDNVYYIERYDAVVIAEYDHDAVLCYDIYCGNNMPIDKILSPMIMGPDHNVIFGFPLKQPGDSKITRFHQKNTMLFILRGKENLFADRKLMFPLLSHA